MDGCKNGEIIAFIDEMIFLKKSYFLEIFSCIDFFANQS
jgi:hypothetical protein